MRIGELARRSGLATTALRYYDKAGLLPASTRTASGYRAYDPDVLPRLAFIRSAQAVGLSLREIREVIGIRDLGTAPCAHVLEPSCGGPDAYPRAPAIGARSHATCRARCGTGSSGVRCRRRLQGHPRWDWLAACSARGRFAAEEKKRASSDFRPAVIHPPRSEYL